MRREVTLTAGAYYLGDQVRLLIRSADAGTVISLEDHRSRRRYTAVVDENGLLIWPPAETPTGCTIRLPRTRSAPMPETLTPIHLPDFARMLLGEQQCPNCVQRCQPADVKAAGIRVGKDGDHYFYYEIRCSHCGEPSMTVVTSRRLGPMNWARQIATWLETGSDPHFLAELPDNPLVLLRGKANPDVGSPQPIHGGYQAVDDGSVMLLVRQNAPFTNDPYRDCLCLVEPRSRLRFSRLKDNECIMDEDWPRFLAAPDGHVFKIGKREWRKLSRAEIETVVKGRLFNYSGKVRHRRKPK